MRKTFLILSFVVTVLPNIEGRSYGENLLAKLNTDIHEMNRLMVMVKRYYREKEMKNPLSYPKNYGSTLRRASEVMDDALKLIKNITKKLHRNDLDFLEEPMSIEEDHDSAEWSRRNNDLTWGNHFYKALSRALKDEYGDNQLIRENVHDGFAPPTLMERPSGQP